VVNEPSPTRAAIYHFPIADAINSPRDQWPDWSLIWVDITHGVTLNEQLMVIRDTDVAHAFQIAAPTDPSPVVEQPDGGGERTANASPLPSTLEGLRALVAEWAPIDRRELGDMMTRESVDRSDPEQVAAAIERYHFHDVTTTPEAPTRPVAASKRRTLPEPAEGDEIDADSAEMIRARYDALDASARSWINAIAKAAQHANTPIHMKDARTLRRFEIMRGLVTLAGGGFDNDDALRGCLVPAIGAELADAMTFDHGQLVGCMGHTEALVFADHAVALVEGEIHMRFLNSGRCRVGRAP